MSISITCPANQRKGPFPVARNSVVSLAVTTGGSAFITYCNQPPAANEPYVTWPQGICTSPTPELDVAENNYLALVICTAGTATLAISDPDELNALPYNNWKTGAEIPLITSTFAGMAVANDGSTAVWSTVAGAGGGLPAMSADTAWRGLYNTGALAAWGPRIDWFVTANTATAAGVQAAVDLALSMGTPGVGYPQVRLLPGVEYQFNTSVVIDIPSLLYPGLGPSAMSGGFQLVCEGMCIFNGSSFASSTKPLIDWIQASGSQHYGARIEGIQFQGDQTSTRAINITGTFITIKRCWFDQVLYGLTWKTRAPDAVYGFTEQCTGEMLTFRSSCQKPILYEDTAVNGQRSFRGTGLIGHNLVNSAGPGYQFINIGQRCLVYMAPLNVDISVPNISSAATINGYTIIANDSDYRIQNFYGTIRSENSVNTPITLASSYSQTAGSRAVYFTGQIQANRQFFRLGAGRVANQTMVSIDEAQAAGSSNPFIGEYHTTQDCAILNGEGQFTSPWSVRADTEIFVRINNAAGLDLRYQLDAAMVTNQVANKYGTIAMNRILYEEDPGSTGTFSDGGVTFDIGAGGLFLVNAPNVTNTTAFLFLDCNVKGQIDVGPSLNELRFRNDMYYVAQYGVTYIGLNSFNVISNADGGNFGKGQSVSYLQVGSVWACYDAVNGARSFTVTSFTKVSVDSANIGTDIVLDPSLYGVGVYSWRGGMI